MFAPQLTPKEMISLGVFNGSYFSSDPKFIQNFPKSWNMHKQIGEDNPKQNLFKVHSGLSREEWDRRGWLTEDCPLGWFQWYCLYKAGIRLEEDELQIKRWRAFTRHRAQVMKNGGEDLTKRRVQRQALLHWAYDPFPDFDTERNETVFMKCCRLKKAMEGS